MPLVSPFGNSFTPGNLPAIFGNRFPGDENLVPESQKQEMVRFSPSMRHIEKNWKQEEMPHADVWSLGKARQLAEKTGVLTPEVGQMMLPIAMVENRHGSMGMNTNEFYDTPQLRKNLEKLEIPIHAMGAIEDDEALYEGLGRFYSKKPSLSINGNPIALPGYHPLAHSRGAVSFYDPNKKARFLAFGGEIDDEMSAKQMAVALAEKARLSKTGHPDEVVSLYNGTGPMAQHYLGKVKEAAFLLGHKSNDLIRKIHEMAYRTK